jgi:hypothetical protein
MPKKEAVNKEPMVDIDTSGDSVDVELKEKDSEATAKKEEETPEVEVKEEEVKEDKEVPVAPTEGKKEEEVKEEDEFKDYSKKVKTRIDKLTHKVREAERREQAAMDFATKVRDEQDKLKSQFRSLDEDYLTEFETRISSGKEAATVKLKAAIEADDIEKQVEAQAEIARLAVDADRLAAVKAEQKAQEERVKQGLEPTKQDATQAQQFAQPPKPDPKAEAWAKKNTWFGQDQAMTYAAFGLHKGMVEQEGYDPLSDEYYNEIDTRMRKEFPHKFSDDSKTSKEGARSKKPVQTVASANRTAKTGRNTVRLTPSQVAIAKKLGVPLEEYAKYVKEDA